MQNYKTQKKKSFWGRLINKSIIASLLTYLSVRFHYLLSESFAARIFYISDKADSLKSEGMLGTLYSKLEKSPVFPKIRHTFAKNVESSRAVKAYRLFVHKVAAASVRSTGVFLLSAGLYSLLGYIMGNIQNGADFRTYYDLVIITFMIIIGVFLLFSQRSNGRKIHESRFFSSLLFDILGINPLAVDKDSPSENHFLAAFLGGLVFGILSFIISVKSTLMLLLAVTALMFIVYSPEFGLLLSMILMSVSGQSKVIPILFASLVSYILKLLRGKRNLIFKSEDIAALFVSLMFIFFFPSGSKLVIALMMTVYFMASNLMRSMEFLKKSINALALGLSLNMIVNAVCDLIAFFGVSPESLSWLKFGTTVPYYEYTAAVSLIFALYMLTEKNCVFPFVYRLVFLISSLTVLALSASETVWVVTLAAVFIYFVYRTLRFFNVAFVYLLLIPLFFFMYTFASYKLDISPFSLGKIALPGIGIREILFGSDMLSENMAFSVFSAFGVFGCLLIILFLYLLFSRAVGSSRYSRNGSREFCALMVGSLCAFFVADAYTAFDMDMLIFWTFCGLISATGNVITSVTTDDEYY